MRANFRNFAIAMIAFVAATASFTSCEVTDMVSYTLEGTWEGNMYQVYTWEGTTYEPSYSQVCFLKDPYTYSSGNGYWVDYFDSYVPWENTTITNHTTWRVIGGTLYIYLIEDDIEFTIMDYRLSDDHFRGDLIGSDGSYGKFNLYHVSSPNWNSYYWDGYYTRSNAEDGVAVEAERPMRITK